SEEVRQRGAALIGLESILLVDPNPRQLLPSPRQLVAAPHKVLLGLEKLEPRREPLFTCSGLVLRHRYCLLVPSMSLYRWGRLSRVMIPLPPNAGSERPRRAHASRRAAPLPCSTPLRHRRSFDDLIDA